MDAVESKAIYLKKGNEMIGLHSLGYTEPQGWLAVQSWANVYTAQYKFLGSVYRIYDPIEVEAEDLKRLGWRVVPPPPPIPEGPPPQEAA